MSAIIFHRDTLLVDINMENRSAAYSYFPLQRFLHGGNYSPAEQSVFIAP